MQYNVLILPTRHSGLLWMYHKWRVSPPELQARYIITNLVKVEEGSLSREGRDFKQVASLLIIVFHQNGQEQEARLVDLGREVAPITVQKGWPSNRIGFLTAINPRQFNPKSLSGG